MYNRQEVLNDTTKDKIEDILRNSILECYKLILNEIEIEKIKIHYWGCGEYTHTDPIQGRMYETTDEFISLEQFSNMRFEDRKKTLDHRMATVVLKNDDDYQCIQDLIDVSHNITDLSSDVLYDLLGVKILFEDIE